MKKILLMSVMAILALGACDRHKEQARERATNADNAIPVPSVSGDTTPSTSAQSVPGRPSNIVTGAMVNTPVPDKSSAMQNTPAPTVAEATVNAGPAASTCGADQAWVGQNLKSIDLSKIKGVIRTYYPDQPVTMDFSDSRLDILLERGTDMVLKVSCG